MEDIVDMVVKQVGITTNASDAEEMDTIEKIALPAPPFHAMISEKIQLKDKKLCFISKKG